MSKNLQIYIKQLGEKSLCFTVKSSDEIITLIDKYKKKTKQEDNLELTYAGITLQSWKKIENYLIPNETTLYIYNDRSDEILIYVKVNSKTFLPISVKPKMRVEHIKSILRDKCGIQIDQFQLNYNGHEMKNHHELQNYKILPNSSILLLPIQPEMIQLRIFYQGSANPMLIEVPSNSQIIDVKNKINKEQHTSITSDRQFLIYEGEQLEDNKQLGDYSINSNNCFLIYETISHFKSNLKFKTPTRKLINFECEQTDKIESIKEKLSTESGIPIKQMKIFSEGKELDDQDTVLVYELPPPKLFDLVQVNEDEGIVFVERYNVQFIPINAKKNDKIIDIKSKIEKREGIPVSDQKLAFKDKNLDDDATLEDCNINLGSKDQLTLILNRTMKLFIRKLNGEHFELLVSPNDDVIDLKQQILAHEKASTRDLRLIFAGKQIEDGSLLRDYGIENDSTIHIALRLKG